MVSAARRLPAPLLIAALALVYFALGRLGLSLAVVNPSASAVWPPSGLALAACLVLGYGVWPGVFLGAFLVNLTTSGAVPASLAIAAGNTLEALAGVYLLERFANGPATFATARDTFKFALLAALGSTTVAATIGTASLALSGLAAPADFGRIWLTWWLGDGMGAMIVAPPLILWSQPGRVALGGRRGLEAAALLAALTAVGLAVFGGWAPLQGKHLPLEFLILPLVAWAAFRFGRRGAAGATLILAAIAAWGTARGFGPFSLEAPNEALLLLQTFLGTVAMTGLGVAAVISEREQTQQRLGQSRDELMVVLQGAADGILAQDSSGRLRYANDAAARLVGFASAEEMLKASRTDFRERYKIYDEAGRPMAPEDLPGRRALRERRRAAATVRYSNRVTGEERWSADQATPVLDANGEVELVINILHDISDLKRAELHQRVLAEAGRLLLAPVDAEAQLEGVARLVVPHLADYCTLHLADEDGTLQLVALAHADPARAAQAAEDGQRHPLVWAEGRTLAGVLRSGQSLLIPEVTEAILEANAASPEHLESLRQAHLTSAMVVPLLAQGRTLGVLAMLWAESGRHYSAADLQVAEEVARQAALAAEHARLYQRTQNLNAELEARVQQRTQALEFSQAQARALSSRLLAAREEERAEMAREIHDELGQQLTGLKMDLARLGRKSAPEESGLRAAVQAMSGQIDGTIQTVRRLATSLRPSLLDDFGLVAALEQQLQDFQKRTGIACRLEAKLETLELEADTTTALFRVCQEALTNVARHAQASEVDIRFEVADGLLLVHIRDNGRGISEQELINNRSLGLAGMRERVLLIGGQLDILGVEGEGTTVRVAVPLGRSES